ncbi:MAG: BF3164 family lipoprotein [Gemmatimonadales bacterium]|nr:BF3164 family lipoprotein [Gemmatimonadales bacterium]MDZ4389528.1 BF3164 family lipoprotein [Gemmatimonadales bacterium]
MLRFLITGTSLVLLACSHGQGGSNPDVETAVPELTTQTAVRVALAPPDTAFHDNLLGQPGVMLATGSWLWIADRTADPFLHAADLTSRSIQRSFGRRGEGPGDLLSVGSISVRSVRDSAVWVYDVRTRRLTEFRAAPHPVTVATVSIPTRALRAWWLDSARILALGAADSNRLMLYDPDGLRLATFRSPLLGADSISQSARVSASSAVKVCGPVGGPSWGMSFITAGRIDLMDPVVGLVGRAQTPITTDGHFVADTARGWSAPIPRLYYVDCAATSRRFYGLFSGRLREAFPGDDASNGREIHVFDWKGRLMRVLVLAADAGYIAVEADTLLYTGAHGESTILRHRIPAEGP